MDENKKIIYLDNAATTRTDADVLAAMQPFFNENYGNPSSLYSFGQEARAVIDNARDKVAQIIGASREEIIFTSGGTESNNFAIYGVTHANKKKGNHIITTGIEHHSVLEPCHFLKKEGYEITYVPVDNDGVVDPNEVKKAITDRTVLITVMMANNEVGTVEPISEIGKIAKDAGVPFHTDAVQAIGSLPVNVNELNCDLLSIAAHKFYGPKGIGALYVRKGTRVTPFIRGGAQERNRRAGTENVPGIVGLAKALEVACASLEERSAKITKLRDKLIEGIFEKIDGIRMNGHRAKRLPNNVNVCVRGVEGEAMLLFLDMKGICASSGSACTSGSLEPSHVLLAMGVPQEVAHGSLRFSLGKHTTEEEINTVLDELPPIVERLRQMSPYIQPEEYYVMKK
jgi:cysteine desulfurase